jgi:TonB family protein
LTGVLRPAYSVGGSTGPLQLSTAPAYFGRYQVLEELGSGAMGVVYLCVDPRLARPVAVKVLKESEFMSPQEREQFHARFRHEAEAAGRLNHPGIVQIYDIGPSYIVMEYLEGRPLNATLRSGAALRVKEITTLVQQVADAIDYAHRHGIVHRDIKPANIMMMADGVVKVLDFGVARLESSNLTAVGTVVGSVRYMAPEQMMGEKVDGRADVFSLAAVAYELLTVRAPFPGKSITEVVARVVQGSHVPPREADARLPEMLNGVFAKAFAPRPERRYNQALDFSRDLAAALAPFQDLKIAHQGSGSPATSIESQATTVKGPAPVPLGTTVRGAPVLAAEPPAAPWPAAASAPSLHREGVLILDSDPAGAQVFIDSKPVGRAPLESVDVTFGRHLVRMELPGRESVSTTIEARPERPLKIVSFTLPLPGPGAGMVRPGQLVSFSPEVQPPVRISGSVPGYPETARDRGLEGTPVVELWVSETGEVFNTALVESAGKALDKALLTAVTRWRFAPATLRGVPVSVRITVQHHFRR